MCDNSNIRETGDAVLTWGNECEPMNPQSRLWAGGRVLLHGNCTVRGGGSFGKSSTGCPVTNSRARLGLHNRVSVEGIGYEWKGQEGSEHDYPRKVRGIGILGILTHSVKSQRATIEEHGDSVSSLKHSRAQQPLDLRVRVAVERASTMPTSPQSGYGALVVG